jgi:hypothetical protein
MAQVPCKKTFLALLSFAAFSIGGVAVASDDRDEPLKGDYAFSETRVCTQFGTTVTSILYGTYTYNGDGTGTFTVTNAPSENTGGGTFSYAVNRNRSFTQEFGPINITFPPGGPNTSGTITGAVTAGQIAEGDKVLVFGYLNRNPETVSVISSSTGLPSTFTRICIRSGSAVKIHGH